MSWMTPAPGATTPTSARLSVVIDRSPSGSRYRSLRRPRGTVPPPGAAAAPSGSAEAQGRRSRRAPRRTSRRRREHEQFALLAHRTEAPAGQLGGQQVGPVLDLYRQYLTGLRERAHRGRSQQPAGVDGDEMVADLLDLPEQVRRHDHGDPEL